MIEKIDGLVHKLTDGWIKDGRFGWRLLEGIRQPICRAYDKWLDG